IDGIATFYDQFRLEPVGEHIVSVCTGTACHVKGAGLVFDTFLRLLGIKQGKDTDEKGKYTVQKVACLGCCTIAPVVQIDDITYGHVKTDNVGQILKDFESHGKGIIKPVDKEQTFTKEIGEIKIGLGSCCVASGSDKVRDALEESFKDATVVPEIKKVGCVGMCHRVPLLEVCLPNEEPKIYDKVKPEEVKKIVAKHFELGSFTKRLKSSTLGFFESLLYDEDKRSFQRHYKDVREKDIKAFLQKQFRIATEFSGEIDPLDLDEYRSHKGFSTLKNILKEKSQKEIISEVKDSGLRGRGGGGFPTGVKWELAADAEDETKYVVCNGDEGDPGAFMDRMILESFPFRVIEGITIAAYAVGAKEGYFYIRAEYPLAVKRIATAIKMCEEAGLLGENILGSDFSLHLKIVEGAGAFVCGEETALIASIEGKRGNPVSRPPFPVTKGLWGHSTLVNNCETYATVPWIIRNGKEEFTKLGTPESKGTKVFSLAGKVKRGGLIEVPMGISIKEIVEEIGGGIEGDKQFKAVQIGGPSGGCVPAHLADTKVDYQDLTNVGAMMGSGGLLVMDENDCMVDIARYFLEFTCEQSCGKCTFCRVGTRLMLDILNKLCEGKGTLQDLEKLKEIAWQTKERSLCGLGKTAPNPVLTTLEYFEEEYIAHINGVCPAKKCKELIKYDIEDSCIGCTICGQECPTGAIKITPYEIHTIDQELCTKCDVCKQVCPNDSVKVI
ncbi:MAG: NAD(P)H-dependent oxidoreductase subunit E, partial [Rhodothermaceae bacterium]